ncbi:MAG: hypothetical protein IPK33_08350 [Gemmatimonadetes bacterium]|nr:hypothetical protein [Gemmatimonadota bacterium]
MFLRVQGEVPPTFDVDVPQVVRIDAPRPGYTAVAGEWLELAAGRHELIFESQHAQDLRVVLDVADSGLTLGARSIETTGCTTGAHPLIREWPVVLRTVEGRARTYELTLGTITLRKEQFAASCSMGPGAWSSFANWDVTISSTPTSATILVDGKPIGSTDGPMSIVYGVASDGRSQEHNIRVAKAGMVSNCQYSLARLRSDGIRSIKCTLAGAASRP